MQVYHSWIVFLVAVLAITTEATSALAGSKRHAAPVAEEDQFRTAEELRRQGAYPRAARAYRRLLADFPKGAHRRQAVEGLYTIAFYWLQDTFEEMSQVHAAVQSPHPLWDAFDRVLGPVMPTQGTVWRHLISCRHLLHWSKSKALFNQERQALALLACVEENDPQGPRAERVLYYMGFVHLWREDYRQADRCFRRLLERHPQSRYAAEALVKDIYTKLMIEEDSPEKQSCHLAETRTLIEKGMSREEISPVEKQQLTGCLVAVNLRQAQLAFQEAERWRRGGHKERARQQYERVLRRYAGTPAAGDAQRRLREMGHHFAR